MAPLFDAVHQNFARYLGGNARGSTNTNLMRGYSLSEEGGVPGVLYTDSATLGSTWEVLIESIYAISMSARIPEAGGGGGSLVLIANAVLDNNLVPTPGTRGLETLLGSTVEVYSATISWRGRLLVGDIIRIGISAGITAIDSTVDTFNMVNLVRFGS